jgi:subtilase family serine protease
MGRVLLVAQIGWRDLRRVPGPRRDDKLRSWINSAVPAAVLLVVTITACGASHPAAGRPSAAQPMTLACDSLATCYSPAQIRVAYGIQPLTDRGIDGRGQTVVLPALAEQRLSPWGPFGTTVTDIREDLAGFDQLFHLPAPRLQVTTTLAPGASRWLASSEEMLDVEMIHAVAPAAIIRVLLFNAAAVSTPEGFITGLIDLVRFGTAHGDVISISAAEGEHCFTSAEVARLNAALQTAASRHVTVVAGSGDIGPVGEPCTVPTPSSVTPVREVSLPASDPLVLAAGGTSLVASPTTGAYRAETAWGNSGAPGTTDQASGGGFSHLFPRPSYQDGIPAIGAARGVPDVAADAHGHTMALVISERGQIDIGPSGGTSVSTPFWAGIIALANQYAGHDLGFVNPALYAIARGPCYHAAFHDITKGNNTVEFPPQTVRGYTAAPGWDPVTGLGSPDARVLIPLLAHDACQ